MAPPSKLTPIRRIPVLKPVPWWCPPRVSMRFVVLVWVGVTAASAVVGRSSQIESPVLSILWIAAGALAYWFWERRRASWLVDQADGTLAVHHRNVFFLPMTGQRLDTIATADIHWVDGPWWRLGWLEIDNQRWDVLDDGQDAARYLVDRIRSAAYEGVTSRAER